MRLFIAAPVSPALAQALSVALQRLRTALPAGLVKWVQPENLHLTLRFFGETPGTEVDEIIRRMREACAGVPALEVDVAGLGCFPDFIQPRVVWAGLHDTARLEALQQAIKSATAEFGESAASGRGRGDVAWHPHLTLGRVKNIQGNDSRRLGRELQRSNVGPFGVWRMDRVVLMQSVLSTSGPRYEELASIELGLI